MDLSTAIKVSASATGGADVDAKLVLFVDERTPNDDCIQILVDLHTGTRRCALGPAKKGDAVLTIILPIAPIKDGQFEATFKLTHPDFTNGSRTLKVSGDTQGAAKVFRRNFSLG
jgi:hypothetical protein